MGDVIKLHTANKKCNSYEADLRNVYENLHTSKSCFKFPTILSKYRKNTNAVKSLHNFLQESIIKKGTPEFNSHHKWCLEILSDIVLLDKIILALQHDIHLYKMILSDHKTSITKSDEISIIQTITKLSYMKDSFVMFKNYP